MLPESQKRRAKRKTSLAQTGTSGAGFSLLEVLVAGAIFTLGLAGFTALLLSSAIGSAQARREGFASMAAANLAEHIRMNPGALGQFLDPVQYVSRICTRDAKCSPEQQADFDFRLWQLELSDRIPGARGIVCRDQTPDDGDGSDDRCDGSGALVIKIFWAGQASGESGVPVNYRVVLPLS